MNKKLHPGMALVFVATLTCGAVSAQIATDGSLGAVKSLAGANINIPESLGKTDGSGSNLFHSFSRFNVGKDQSVYFVGRDGIRNVLARVTGGERSAINGTLGIQRPGGMMPVPIDTANLWLINPAGIHFGPSARLDVGGSFFTGSADRIVFSDGAVFDATPTKPTLTAASPCIVFHEEIREAASEADQTPILEGRNVAARQRRTSGGEPLAGRNCGRRRAS